MIQERLHKQMSFIREIEKLKVVYRQNGTMGNKRQENSAEHSWHIAMMALVLQEYFPHKIDVFRVVKMLLIHDIVEVYAGDTFLYDDKKRLDAKKIEKEAAKKIFSLLPEEQAEDFYTSWLEFEEVTTKEAEFAKILDNLQPIINHYTTRNQNIIGKELTKRQIAAKKSFIKELAPELWEYADMILDKSVEIGLYKA